MDASYVKQYNLKITGETASADVASASFFPVEFEAMIDEKGDLEQVFNCDDTTLFWKKMPNRTYIQRNARQTTGFKPFKGRPTLALCGNAAGHVIKPALICRACTPRSIKNRDTTSLPAFWQHSRKAWMTAILFWNGSVGASFLKSYLSLKGLPFKLLLIIDSAPAIHNPLVLQVKTWR
uniref:DDE-1 domain-containing protein n=1 Tax=Trichuris muris TaxID=70415 RepID=A0A5S6QH24_TRIMR